MVREETVEKEDGGENDDDDEPDAVLDAEGPRGASQAPIRDAGERVSRRGGGDPGIAPALHGR